MESAWASVVLGLLLAFSSGVQSEAGDLKDVCATGNACISSNHVCDKYRTTATCQVKVGGQCGHETECVAGATCTGSPSVCGCTPGDSSPSGDICVPDSGMVLGGCNGTCQDHHAACVGRYNKTCTCISQFTVEPLDFTCVFFTPTCPDGANTLTASLLFLLSAMMTSRLV